MSLEILNLTKKNVNNKKFEKIYRKILRYFKIKNLEISLVFVGDKRIRNLNRKYRKEDKVTDVLSFNYKDNTGEIFINLNKMKSEKDDIRFFVHGILHILGFNHKNKKELKKMIDLEEKFIKC